MVWERLELNKNCVHIYHISQAAISTTMFSEPLVRNDPIPALGDESIGIKDPVKQDESRCDFKHFCDSYIKKCQNHYVAKLPWKNVHPPLMTNYQTSEIRTGRMVDTATLNLTP